jgi:hypothetical protein
MESGHEDAKDSYPKLGGKVLLVFSVVMGSAHADAKDSSSKCGRKVLLVFLKCCHGIRASKSQGFLPKVRRKDTPSFPVLSRHPGTIKI